MPDSTSSRPRLVSVRSDAATPPTTPESPPEPARAGKTVPQRLLWLVVALALVAAAGWGFQTQNVHSLVARNAMLAGELFTARTALEAYSQRFVEVRESVGSLQAELARLGALVNDDPATAETEAPPAPVEPASPLD